MSTTRRRLLDAAAERLRMAKIDTPELDARVLLKAALKLDDVELISAADEAASPEGALDLDNMVTRRVAGEPVARIIGHREFWGMRFDLGVETLIPRPESETLVEAAVAAFGRGALGRVLDLGTGTGCLLIAALSEFPDASGLGVDIAPGAVDTARANAERLGLGQRAEFAVSDWGQAVEGRFDLILCNPPYIATGDLAGLDTEVRLHDPGMALDGGEDGLEAYRRVLAAAEALLAPEGLLILELGAGQEDAVAEIALLAGLRPKGPAAPDLAGIPRALVVGW